MDLEDRSLDDCDGPVASFRGATLQIQQDLDNPAPALTDDVALLPVSQAPSGVHVWSSSVASRSEIDSPGGIDAGASRTDIAALAWSDDHVRNLFSSREGLVDQALADSITAFVKPEVDGDVLGSWLLTEINIWDAEKERLVLLTTNSLLVIKFDFIALKPMDVRRTPLQQVDTVVVGELVYPPASLVPRMNGLASGVSTIVKGCLLHWARPSELCHTALDVSQFEPRARNSRGLRVMWNNGEPIAFSKKWNPFNNDIPFLTFTSHPLLRHIEGSERREEIPAPKSSVNYDVESLSKQLPVALAKFEKSSKSMVQDKPILLHNYLSVGSLIHNRNSLGFFKVRGRFSF